LDKQIFKTPVEDIITESILLVEPGIQQIVLDNALFKYYCQGNSQVLLTIRVKSHAIVTFLMHEACIDIVLDIQARATVSLVYTVPECSNTFKNFSLKVLLAEESKFVAWFSSIYSNYQAIRVHMQLCGPRAYAHVKALVACNSEQRPLITTLQHHVAPDAESSVNVKSIVAERAFFTYEGAIKIDTVASGTKAAQKTETLLRGSHARALATPALEVLNHEVQCTHGAAIGYLQEDQLLYLQSRGLSSNQAQRLLLQGFFEEFIVDVPFKVEQQRLRDKLNKES
jgi:Fe-S cluster assembly scaffold protein SufB